MEGIKYAFYSAALGIAIQEARKEAEETLVRAAERKESDDDDEGASGLPAEERPKIMMSADDDDEDVPPSDSIPTGITLRAWFGVKLVSTID